MTPSDLESRYNAFRGTIYGQSSNSRFAAFRRPPIRSARYPNLFYVGGGTHPGGGVPLVILSSAIVTRIITHAGHAA
jgi:phytoene desaturase